MFCTPLVTPNSSVPLVVDVPIGFTKPAMVPETPVSEKHGPLSFTNVLPLTGNTTKATSDPLAGFGKTNPKIAWTVFVMIKPALEPLDASHVTPAAVLSVHSKKCTVTPPTNVAFVTTPPLATFFAQVTVSPPPVRTTDVVLAPETVEPVGLNSGAAD